MITEKIIEIVSKGNNDYSSVALRTKLGAAAGFVGIIANVTLTLTKAAIGILSGSISIVADAFNNLTDTASSIVSIIGIMMSGKASDKEHPYGHGRGEYIATLIVASVIIFVSLTLFKSSVEAIINPKPIEFSLPGLLVLLLSIGLKFWMYKFYGTISKKIDSSPLKASALDSLSDVMVTSAVVFSFINSRFTSLPLDGVAGLVVSGFIFKNGYDLINETISQILGEDVDSELHKTINEIVLRHEPIIDTHDLNIHSYGPHNKYGTIDVVVPNTMNLEDVYYIFSEIEHHIMDELGVYLTIRMDIEQKTKKGDRKLIDLMKEYAMEHEYIKSFHDAKVLEIYGEKHVAVHMVVNGETIKTNVDEEREITELKDFLCTYFPDCAIDITIDRNFD